MRSLTKLFNSLDPSPFWDRDLDPTAAQFIEDEFREKLSARAWHLDVHTLEEAGLAADLQAAVEHYYNRLAASMRLRLHERLRVAELGLLGGLAIFLACMTARQLLSGVLQGVPRFLNEGLIVLAWLALWRPTEAMVYGWVPLYRKRRLYQRLAEIHVTVRSEVLPGAVVEPSTETPHAGGHSTPRLMVRYTTIGMVDDTRSQSSTAMSTVLERRLRWAPISQADD